MADGTELKEFLTDLAESGRREAAPATADRIRARGEQRVRRKRAALASGGTLLVATLVMGGLSLPGDDRKTAPPAASPTPVASLFVPPTPVPGQEYAVELGYVYAAVAKGDVVEVTVEPVRTERGGLVRAGVVHTLTLPGRTPVEVQQLVGGAPADMELSRLVDRLSGEPRWVFAVDYDDEGHVRSLREAFWLAD